MFLGHIAVGFASKRWAPRTPLVLLVAAPLLADLLWPLFLLFGIEHVRIDPGNTRFTPFDFYDYPWSHSLLALVFWACIIAGLYAGIARYRAGTIALWIGVVSHWVLDWITHRPDMPLYPGSHRYGLGLWNSIAGTMIVELALFAVGIWLYLRATKARDRIGAYSFVAFVVVLLAIYVSNLFGGPPPSVKSVIWSAIVAEPLLLLWVWWFDRHRVTHEQSQPTPVAAAR
ncbi:MAG: metal-dependent hydrolase [Acidobacteriota bacterium]